jgi:hypothetical protein
MFEQHGLKNFDDNVMMDYSDKDCSKLLTIKQFCEVYPWPSESAMRAYVYRAAELGISDAFLRVRRRVLIMPQIFFSLIKQIESRSIK